jgi:hypothetical protein
MRHFLRLILRFDENQIVAHACQDRFLVLDERDLIENPASGKTRLQFVSIGSANSEIAAELNKKGWRSSGNRPFSAEIIQQLCRNQNCLLAPSGCVQKAC